MPGTAVVGRIVIDALPRRTVQMPTFTEIRSRAEAAELGLVALRGHL